jgi:hypothetical protein
VQRTPDARKKLRRVGEKTLTVLGRAGKVRAWVHDYWEQESFAGSKPMGHVSIDGATSYTSPSRAGIEEYLIGDGDQRCARAAGGRQLRDEHRRLPDDGIDQKL